MGQFSVLWWFGDAEGFGAEDRHPHGLQDGGGVAARDICGGRGHNYLGVWSWAWSQQEGVVMGVVTTGRCGHGCGHQVEVWHRCDHLGRCIRMGERKVIYGLRRVWEMGVGDGRVWKGG